jgi:agmatine/peptidylarginine deiminase
VGYFEFSHVLQVTMTSHQARSGSHTGFKYVAPVEEAPHLRTWMCWPATQAVYGALGYFESIQETSARLAAAITEHEPVVMMAGARWQQLAKELCGRGIARRSFCEGMAARRLCSI